MRKVYGEELTVKKLKQTYFNSADLEIPDEQIVIKIVAFEMCWEVTEEADYIVGYPTNFENGDAPIVIHNDPQKNLTVWNFITKNFEDLDLDEYTFYFWK